MLELSGYEGNWLQELLAAYHFLAETEHIGEADAYVEEVVAYSACKVSWMKLRSTASWDWNAE